MRYDSCASTYTRVFTAHTSFVLFETLEQHDVQLNTEYRAGYIFSTNSVAVSRRTHISQRCAPVRSSGSGFSVEYGMFWCLAACADSAAYRSVHGHFVGGGGGRALNVRAYASAALYRTVPPNVLWCCVCVRARTRV